MKNKYYIAYGSNLNVPQMLHRCHDARLRGTTELNGWELLFKGSMTGSYLTIEQAEGAVVPVAVWEVSITDELALDRYEGFPNFYYKKDLNVRFKSLETGRFRTVSAFVYIMHEDRPIGTPSDVYMRTCYEGYETFGFDKRVLVGAYEKCKNEMEASFMEEG